MKRDSSRQPLYAKCSLVAEVRTGLTFDSGGDALRRFVAMIGCRSQTASSIRTPKYSVTENMSEGGTVELRFVLVDLRFGKPSPGTGGRSQ